MSLSLKRNFVLTYKASLFVVVIAGWFFIFNSLELEKGNIKKEIFDSEKQIAEIISYNADYLQYQLSYAAKQIADKSIISDRRKISKILSSFALNISNQVDLSITWNAFSWIDKNDEMLVDGAFGILTKPVNMATRDYLKITKTIPNKLVIGKPINGALSGRFIVPIAIGVFSDQNQYLGTLVFGLDIEKILFKINRNISSDAITFAVINKDEVVFKSENLSDENHEFIASRINKIFAESKNIIRTQGIFSKNKGFVGIREIKNSNLKIVVFYDKNRSYDQLFRVLVKQSMLIILIILVCAILFQRMYKKVIKPVSSLSELALKISKEDFSFAIKKPKVPELGEVYETLNSTKAISQEAFLKKQLEITNKKLKKINEAKAEFLAKSSHDIKNYIFGIYGLSRLILENKKQSEILGNEDLQMIETISEQSEELMDFVEDLLDTNQIDSGDFALEKIQDCAVGDLIDRIILLNKSFAIRNKIYLKTEIENNLPKLRCDARRMKQILANLINNAVKYSKAGSDVVIKAKHLKEEQKIYLEIIDSGVGMSEEEIKMILSGHGKDIDKSSLEKVDSHGIGMPIVLKLVELHQGKIEIDSKKNIGTKVKLFFEIDPKKLQKTEGLVIKSQKEISRDNSSKNKKILIVEDNPVNIKVTARILSDSGYQTRHAENGLEALKILDEENFDLILMDGEMPIMNGYEATKQIREGKIFKNFKNYQNIPIVALTSSSEAKIIELAKSSGMNFHLEKSTSKTKLINAVDEWINHASSKN